MTVRTAPGFCGLIRFGDSRGYQHIRPASSHVASKAATRSPRKVSRRKRTDVSKRTPRWHVFKEHPCLKNNIVHVRPYTFGQLARPA